MKATRTLIMMVALVAFANGGCTLFADSTQPPCIDNLDCDLGYHCDLDINQCVKNDNPQPLSIVDLELTPKKGTGAAVTQLAELDLRKQNVEDIPLTVTAAILLSGQVLSSDAMGGVPGTLVTTRQPGFDNRATTWNVTVGDSGDFETEVSEGAYDILFKPSNRDNFPQLAVRELPLPYESPPNLGYLHFADPAVDDLNEQDPMLVVRGRVLQSQLYPHPATAVKIEGVTDQGLRTSYGYPDEEGYFYLRLPFARSVDPVDGFVKTYPASMDITIRPATSEAKLPEVKVEGVELGGAELGTFYIGYVAQLRTLSGVVVDDRGRPVADCQLQFTSDEIGNGTLTHQVLSDETGNYTASLPEGSYRLMAVPEMVSDASLTSMTVELVADQTLNITVPDRPVLSGTVTDFDGNPVGEVVVRARRLSTVAGFEDGVIRSFEEITTSDGVFAMAVDYGRYSVTFIPPAASGLPRSLPKPVYITGTAQNDDYVMSAEATRLAPPTVIQGHVYGPGAPPETMCGVTIEVFHSPDEETTYLIGQTISDSEEEGCTGSYAVIIPSDLLP